MNLFPNIFYAAAVSAALAALLVVFIRQHTQQYAAARVLFVPIVLAYLLGMYRTFGVDFDTYELYLGAERDRVPDLGYKLLMEITYVLGLRLSEFFLLQALFTLYAIHVLAKKLKSDFIVTVTLYVAHAAIVRDFSQSRIALALAIYFIALAQDRRLSYVILTIAATSVHLSLAPLVVVYHWCRMVVEVQRGQLFLIVAPAAAVMLGMALLLPMLTALDPRIELYINWSEDLYGNPVGSYSALALFVVIGAVIYRAYQVTGDRTSKAFAIMILYAVVTFIAFRHLAVFAFRLSNVVAALYPFAIGRAIYLLKSREQNRLFDVALPLAMLGAVLLAVIIRPGSLDVLEETQPALLTYGP